MLSSRKAGAQFTLIFFAIMLLFTSFPINAFAVDPTVLDSYQKGPATGNQPDFPGEGVPAGSSSIPGSNTTSGWTYLFQVVFSLGIVAVLIYLLLRFLANRQFTGLQASGPIKVISATSLGNGKTLQLVMIGDSLYVLGIGENVQLLRHIPTGEEMDVVLADAEMKASTGLNLDWLPFLRKRNQEEASFVHQQAETRTFEELLTKQWDEVQRKGDRQ